MAYKRTLALCLALAWGAASAAAQEARKPLVRKDLLVFGSGEIAPPLRDIFRPKAAAAAPVLPRQAGPSVKPVAPPPETKPSFALNLSYVGSVKVGDRIVALVLRNGQTVSVGEGDEVAPGYRAVRVTAEEVVVEGPNAERRTFTRQGERP